MNLDADALVDELASGPKVFPQGVGRAIYVFRQARASKWPDEVKLRVYKSAQEQVADVLRPKLNEIASLAPSLSSNLDGLIKARAAMNEVEAYRQSLTEAFGVLDQESILIPMWDRIAALEADPAIAMELRVSLDAILRGPNPRTETEHLIFAITGYQALSAPLAAIAKDGLRRAEFAEVVIENRDTSEDAYEPRANDIALHVFGIAESEITRLVSGYAVRVRVKTVRKTDCVEEKPRQQYLCFFDHEFMIVSAHDGKPVMRDNIIFRALMPNGRTSSSTSARFVRNPLDAGWRGSALGAK